MKFSLQTGISIALTTIAVWGLSFASQLFVSPSFFAANLGIDQRFSAINFSIQNAFNGVFLWNTGTNISPITLSLGTGTRTCSTRINGYYYNNQRGARLWPLDSTSLTTLQGLDGSYNSLSISGGLYTDCTGYPGYAYGRIIHNWSGTNFWLGVGLTYDLVNKTYTGIFAQTMGVTGWTAASGWIASGYLFDSQGAIGIVSETGTITITPPPPPAPICGNNIVESGEQCDGSSNCKANCTFKTTNNGGSNPSPEKDFCPDGDFSSSYYDDTCGTGPQHGAAIIPEPVGKACLYADAQYLAKGPFTDTFRHWGYPYTELMRISCLHRGRGTSQGLWIYEPDGNITRAEAVKTFVKILGISFEDFTIQSEDTKYPGASRFADVPQDHWFAWYVDYAMNKGLLDGLVTQKNGQSYFWPDEEISRFEAIKLMMISYDKIKKEAISLQGRSVMGDVIDSSSPYYQYIRKAEVLGFISGVPQQNGSYNFEGQRDITRAEFAKIVSVPFADQLFDIQDLVEQSGLYRMVVEAINKTKSDQVSFALYLFDQLDSVDANTFIKTYKVQKKVFLETLKEIVMQPLLESIEDR